MQTAMMRLYDDPYYRRLNIEAPISRAKAMEKMLTGFRAATEFSAAIRLRVNHDVFNDDNLFNARYMEWAGYELYRVAAPLGQQHLTRVQLYPALAPHRWEYVFPGGLSPTECDDLCLHAIGMDDEHASDQQCEWLVTSTLAGMLHGDGVSLADYVVAFACGRIALVYGLVIIPTTPPTTLCAAVRDRGWSATAEWLRATHIALEQALDTIRANSAVWVPKSAPKPPWEPIILLPRGSQECLRLALGAEAAAYAGHRVKLAVSDAERADWLSDREAAKMAGMSLGQWRRWITTHREVRIGRPITRDGRLAGNRRLIHRGDLRRALRLAPVEDDGETCKGEDCPQRCWKTNTCFHRDRECPAR